MLKSTMLLSIIVPCYNEEETIPLFIEAVEGALKPEFDSK